MKTVLCLLLIVSSLNAHAQKFELFKTDSAMGQAKGTTHYLTTLEHFQSEENDKPISIAVFNAEMSHYVVNRLSMGLGFSGMIARGTRFVLFEPFESNTVGLGAFGFFRFDVANFSNHNFYIETGFGVLLTANRFPAGGTHLNGSSRHGLGYNVRLRSGQFLFFGYRWLHISNGRGFVPENPAYDGNGIYIGFKFMKDR